MARYAMVIDLRTCLGCQACTAACTQENQTPYWHDKWRTQVNDVQRGKFPHVTRDFFPRLCMHCENAPCVEVCPTGASYRTKEGVVLVDYEKCMGCQACVVACPYGARYPYEREDVAKAKEIFGEDNRHKVPHVDKCTFCYHRLAEGLEPACVATCPGEARLFGDLDDPNSKVAALVSSGQAKPLEPGFGTKPRVFYIW